MAPPRPICPARHRAGAALRPAPRCHRPSLRQRGDRGRAPRRKAPGDPGRHGRPCRFCRSDRDLRRPRAVSRGQKPTGRLRKSQEAFRDAVWRRASAGRWSVSRRRAGRAGRQRLHQPRAASSAEGRAMSHDATNWAIQQRGLKPDDQDRALAPLRPASTRTSAASPRRRGWPMIAKSAVHPERTSRPAGGGACCTGCRASIPHQAPAADTLHPGVRGRLCTT
jgi:hypothetical protein